MRVKSTSLKKISVKGCDIQKTEAKALRKVLDEGVLRLDASYNALGDLTVELIKGLRMLELDLSGCQLSKKGIQAVCETLQSL